MTMQPMEDIPCGACHMIFGLPPATVKALRKSGDDFYCPAGHPLSYRPTKAEKLSTLLTKRCDELRQCARTREALRRSNAALRGVITRMRRSAARDMEAGT